MRPNKKSKRDIDSQPFPIKFFLKKKKKLEEWWKNNAQENLRRILVGDRLTMKHCNCRKKKKKKNGDVISTRSYGR